MHIDYTLVIKETQEIILAIELDDKSHHSKKANINDPKKMRCLKNQECITQEYLSIKCTTPSIVLLSKLASVQRFC